MEVGEWGARDLINRATLIHGGVPGVLPGALAILFLADDSSSAGERIRVASWPDAANAPLAYHRRNDPP